MHIQPVSGINAEQKKLETQEINPVTGTPERFQQQGSGIPETVANNISAVSNDIVNSIDTTNSAPVIGHPPKITVVNMMFVISDDSNGLVYNYQVVSIDGAWSISLSSIVG